MHHPCCFEDYKLMFLIFAPTLPYNRRSWPLMAIRENSSFGALASLIKTVACIWPNLQNRSSKDNDVNTWMNEFYICVLTDIWCGCFLSPKGDLPPWRLHAGSHAGEIPNLVSRDSQTTFLCSQSQLVEKTPLLHVWSRWKRSCKDVWKPV